ncbi:uncharacterized protein BJ171DRAFT_488896 [Polychytrium aggregatum]|uniref:uncharacterized protein n=1 Tax=Polychytrium aggregatum TaxID=110093 RepID=UPI0022FDF9D8|nr:uncharacterized protein BJ171DRAFT_488896 [Polychytrium aggregatum]KAI9208433.1 hypothetical protein BJ171DRAFT_488896 [Polychytrium aggregatum]
MFFLRCMHPRRSPLGPGLWRSFSTGAGPSTDAPSASLLQRLIRNKHLAKYAEQFRAAPGSHLVSFLVLHELTAIAPLPLLYFGLSYFDIQIPFPEEILAEGNRRMTRLLQLAGAPVSLRDDSQMMLHLVTSYALVKAAMPLRLGLSVFLTPYFARFAVLPLTNAMKRLLPARATK